MDKKVTSKLAVSVLALLLAASLVATSSYAWLVLSGDPEVGGMQINIGGSNTILVAADLTHVEEDGSISHYPGEFGQTINFLQYESYDYLKEVTGLLPVSTSDGVYWFLPEYYGTEDRAVKDGTVINGQIKDITEFYVDSSLDYANQNSDTEKTDRYGHYIYLDFWVVSPAGEYKLRVSTGSETENSGSYAISLMEPVETDANGDGENDSYGLTQGDETAAASLRIGFLANQDGADSRDVLRYLSSETDSPKYNMFLGQYQSPGESIEHYSAARNHFTIYEPNGDLHPQGENGYYLITEPLGLNGGVITETDISDRLTVQNSSAWKLSSSGQDTMLEQEFKVAAVNKVFGEQTTAELRDQFYRERLQGQLGIYLSGGRFIRSTENLYAAAAATGGMLEKDAEVLQDTGGATEDVYITVLQKNAPQRIRMFIWIEGQDADCVNHADVSGFALNIELAGSNES